MWSASVIYPWASLVSYFFDDIARRSEIISFIELFWKNSTYVSDLSVCIFVTLWLCVFGCVLQGPISLELPWVDARNQRLSDPGIKTWQGHFETVTAWFLSIYCLLLRLKVFRSITYKYLCDSIIEHSDNRIRSEMSWSSTHTKIWTLV